MQLAGANAPARSRHALPRSFWRWIRGCEPAIHRQNGHGAEGVGFEPTVPYETHALQACRFGRSRIPPEVTLPSRSRPPFCVAAGSCATGTREPSQGRKAAALSGPSRVPQSSLAAAPNGGHRWERGRVESGPLAYQSLYRRYRPQRFSELRGQDHVSRTLRNAVRENRVAHAYLLSGPRGTGKTSSARILAKALNCAQPNDGEPCGECESCVGVTNGTSLDVHELDAASNNGVEAMRDLVARAALGTPGRWKVYIVDEVHMLSAAASNALLKTLEEPPGPVVFVLATTDPQKVLPTIRSRTQHFEFRLLQGEVLAALVSDVTESAGLTVPSGALDLVVRRGNGSARDALSVLDQVAALGDVSEDGIDRVDELLE